MQIRIDPKRLWRRIELAKIKARASYERQALLYQAEYRESKRLDDEEEERRSQLPARERLLTYYPRHAWNMLLFRHIEDHSYKLGKYQKLCDEAVEFVELDEQEWDEIERWRKAPFARHPSNAEAFPEIAPSPHDRA